MGEKKQYRKLMIGSFHLKWQLGGKDSLTWWHPTLCWSKASGRNRHLALTAGLSTTTCTVVHCVFFFYHRALLCVVEDAVTHPPTIRPQASHAQLPHRRRRRRRRPFSVRARRHAVFRLFVFNIYCRYIQKYIYIFFKTEAFSFVSATHQRFRLDVHNSIYIHRSFAILEIILKPP